MKDGSRPAKDRRFGARARAAMCLLALAAWAGVCVAQQTPPPPVTPAPADTGFSRTGPKEPADKGLDTVVSVEVSDMDLAEALRCLHDASGLNFAMGSQVQGKVTCSIQNKPTRLILSAMLGPNGFDYVERDGIIIVQKAGPVTAPKAPAVAPPPIIRRSFTIPYLGSEVLTDVVGSLEEGGGGGTAPSQVSTAKTMDQVIQGMLSPVGKMIFYEREHLFIIEDYEPNVQNIADLVAKLWEVPSQVFIDAKLLEVELDNDSALGLQWQAAQAPANRGDFTNTTSATSAAPFGLLTGNPGTAAGGYSPAVPTYSGQSTTGFVFGISNQHLDVLISALAARARVDTRSNPRLLVANHRKATIVAGEEVPYLTSVQSTGALPINSYSFKEVAVRLEITPHASEDGMIFLDVHPTVKNVIGYTGTPAQPILSVREASTSVVMEDGTTLIIGGLLKRDIDTQYQEVPFLARIPVLGWLFQQKAASDQKNDMVFMVNPRILTPKLLKELSQPNNAATLGADMNITKNPRTVEPPDHPGESPADKPKW